MPTFTLHEALRYLVSAVVVATYVAMGMCQSEILAFRERATDAGVVALALTAGGLAFNAYRQIVYNVFIRLTVDLARWRGPIGATFGIGPRNLFRRELGIELCSFANWIRATELWAFCQISWTKAEAGSSLRVWGAGVHAFYFLMTASFVAAIAACCPGLKYTFLAQHCWIPIALMFAGGIFGLVADVFLENAETMLAAATWREKHEDIRAAWRIGSKGWL